MEIITILNNIGYTNLIDAGSVWRTKPLYRSSNNPSVLCIKKTTGQFYDHVEKIGGSLSQLVQKTLGLASVNDSKAYLGDLPITIDNRFSESIELTQTKVFDKNILIKLIKDNSYWNNRNISDFTLNQFGGGVAVTKGRMIGRYVIPIFSVKDDLIGFAGRQIRDNPLFCSWKLIGNKKEWVFPLINNKFIVNKKEAILVESIGNMLSLWEIGIKNTLVLFGCQINSKIIQELIKCDVNKIHLILDNDSDNNFVGNLAAESIKSDLMSFFDENQINIITPPKNDLNDMLIENPEELKIFLELNGIKA